jgi:hypothetical protein
VLTEDDLMQLAGRIPRQAQAPPRPP